MCIISTLTLASTRISIGSPLVYDHYTQLHIVATLTLDMIHIVNQYRLAESTFSVECLTIP